MSTRQVTDSAAYTLFQASPWAHAPPHDFTSCDAPHWAAAEFQSGVSLRSDFHMSASITRLDTRRTSGCDGTCIR